MGTSASRQVESTNSITTFDDARSQSTVQKRQEIQDENEKALETHQNYLV